MISVLQCGVYKARTQSIFMQQITLLPIALAFVPF